MSEVQRLKTGITALDDILHGGLIPERLYLVDGNPGSGKTTLRPAISAGRRASRARNAYTSRFRRPGRSSRRAPHRTGGRWMGSISSS